MKKLILFFALVILPFESYSETFKGHCRDRHPDLIVDKENCKGPVPVIIEIALNRLGHDITWSERPWKRSLLEAKNGSVDILPRHSMDTERAAFLHAVAYGYRERKVFYMISPHQEIEINAFEDLMPHRIGLLRGSFYSDKFAKADNLIKIEFTSNDQIIKMLEAGRIDIALTSSAHEEDKFRVLPGIKEAKYFDTFLNSRNISIPKKSPMAKYYTKFKSEIESMANSGEINKIFDQYGIKPPSQK